MSTNEASYVEEPGIIGAGEVYILDQPELSDWECQMFGSGRYGMLWRPAKGEVPNWFWRQMQYLCFGHRWRRAP